MRYSSNHTLKDSDSTTAYSKMLGIQSLKRLLDILLKINQN